MEMSGGKVMASGDKVAISNDKVAENHGIMLTVHEEKIIGYLQKNKVITNAIAREIIDLSESGTRKVLKNMVEKQLLLATGKNRDRKYYLSS